MNERKNTNPDDLVIGVKDDNGYTITKIYTRTVVSVVYDIGSPLVSESLKTYILDPSGVAASNYTLVSKELNEVKSKLKKSTSENFHRLTIGSAINLAVLGKIEDSKAILATLSQTIDKEYKDSNQRRLIYSWTSIMYVNINLLFCLLIYKTDFFGLLTADDLLKQIFYTIAMSSIGGSISLIIKLDKFKFSNEPSKTVFAYSFERMILASFAGIAAFVLMKSNLLLGVLAEQPSIYGFLSAAIIAGFSEKFIPDVIRKIEKEDTSKIDN